jgi:hypothetical protein
MASAGLDGELIPDKDLFLPLSVQLGFGTDLVSCPVDLDDRVVWGRSWLVSSN